MKKIINLQIPDTKTLNRIKTTPSLGGLVIWNLNVGNNELEVNEFMLPLIKSSFSKINCEIKENENIY